MENLNFIYQVALNVITFVLLVVGVVAYFTSPSAFKAVMKDFRSLEIAGTMVAISVLSLIYFPVATTVFTVGSLVLVYGLDYFSKRRVTDRITR